MSDTELKSCMTLDEAIEHCKEKADCTKCGMEHQQLAEWLIELKSRRNAMERIVEQIVEQKQIVAKMKELFALNQKMNQELLQAKKYASQLMESVLQEAFSVQETEKPSQVIEFYSNQTTSETELLAAARGKILEDTWEHLCKRALEIAGEEC